MDNTNKISFPEYGLRDIASKSEGLEWGPSDKRITIRKINFLPIQEIVLEKILLMILEMYFKEEVIEKILL